MTSLPALVWVYSMVLLLVLLVSVAAEHLRFVAKLSLPLLVMLAVIWGIVLDQAQVPRPGFTGWQYAVFTWLRLVACAAALQACFLPLLRSPGHLRAFIAAWRLPRSLAVLILGALVFLPEVQRRLGRVVDARRAQGFRVSGLQGLRDSPRLVTPLVSSLLSSAVLRAEFWGHRDILGRQNRTFEGMPVAWSSSLGWLSIAAAGLAPWFTRLPG